MKLPHYVKALVADLGSNPTAVVMTLLVVSYLLGWGVDALEGKGGWRVDVLGAYARVVVGLAAAVVIVVACMVGAWLVHRWRTLDQQPDPDAPPPIIRRSPWMIEAGWEQYRHSIPWRQREENQPKESP